MNETLLIDRLLEVAESPEQTTAADLARDFLQGGFYRHGTWLLNTWGTPRPDGRVHDPRVTPRYLLDFAQSFETIDSEVSGGSTGDQTSA